MTAVRSRDDRILVRDGRRHHRPRYSRTEFRVGLACLAGLVLVLAWVARRGANPDPALFEAPVVVGDAAPAVRDGTVPPSAGPGAASAPADRGPLPAGLAADGWAERGVSSFGSDDLYEKINGREGYYKQFGFRRLWFTSLVLTDDAATSLDIELYDLSNVANALGAALGERPEGARPTIDDRGLTLLHRNALFAARGPYYVRAIGSDESATVVEQLERVRERIDAGLPAEAPPWAWALYAGELGLDPGSISYIKENAFSFGFASDVYAALLGDESELFVVRAEDAGVAAELAARFNRGFVEYGEPVGRSLGVEWSRDRYIATVSGAKPVGAWTIGVRGAPDLAAAEASLRDLEEAVTNLGGDR